MILEDITGKWKSVSVNAKCDECGTEYKAKISTALRQKKIVGHHQCRYCSSRRAGKKTAEKMGEIYSLMYSGDNNFSKKPGVGEKISKALKGKSFSEEHKQKLRKPKLKKDKIIEASNRPEEVQRRKNRMILNNPMNKVECREKVSKTISELYSNGNYNRICKKYKTGWVKISKTFNAIWCRSGLEKEFLYKSENCDKIKLIESAENLRISYEYNGSQHKYLPDFKVVMDDDSFFIVEIKGSYFETEPKWIYKKAALKEFCEKLGIIYVILTEKDIDKWLEQLKS